MSKSIDTDSLVPGQQPPGRDEVLDEVIAGYLRAVQRGSVPDRQRLLAAHPDLAGDLAEFFADQDRFDHLAAPLRAAVASSGPRLPEEIGPHVILGEISRGGMGVVLRARHRELGRLVAIKLLLAGPYAPAEDVQRFRREAEAAANLDHPNIVPIYEILEYQGLPCFSMKLMQTSLAQHLRSTPRLSLDARTTPLEERMKDEGGRMNQDGRTKQRLFSSSSFILHPSSFLPGEAARLLVLIGRAVHHAHQRGILHRDLKPANILLDEHGQPHVSDFGLARRSDSDSEGLTQTGALVGTPAYMAPEQATARGEITVATDVYGLGAILYECLTERPPFKAESPLDTLRLVQDQEPIRPRALNPKVDADLETICLKCLQKDPAKRYASAHDLVADLERYLQGEPILARRVGRLARIRRWVRRQPVVAGLTAALLVAVAAGIVTAVISFRLVVEQWHQTEGHLAQVEIQRDAARKALEEARVQRQRADKAAEAAEASFRQAHEAVNDFCVSLSDELARAPGLQPTRRKLLQNARSYYQNFVKQRGHDVALRRELADTHDRVGRICILFGDRRQAQEEFGAALAIYRELQAAKPDDLTIQHKVASTMLNLANQQDTSEALATSEAALKLYAKLLAEHGENRELAIGRALLLANRGARLFNIGRIDESRAALEEAAMLQEALLRKYPTSDQLYGNLSSTLDNYGVLLAQQNDLAGAFCCGLRAHELRVRWAATQPDDAGRQTALAALRYNIGISLRDLGQKEAARAVFTEALAMRRKLAAQNPQVPSYQRDLATSLNTQGAIHLAEKRYADALRDFEQGRAILTRLLNADRSSPVLRRMLAEAWFKIGATYGAKKEWIKEADAYQHARPIQEALVRSNPENPEYRHALGRTLQNMAFGLSMRKEEGQAREVLRQAIASTEQLLARSPKVRSYRVLLGSHYGLLAEIERRMGNAAESVRLTLLRQRLWPGTPVELYRCATALGRAARLLGSDPAALSPSRKKEQDRYLDLAQAALRQAVQAGYRNVHKMRTDDSLELLRSRAEFAELLNTMRSPRPGS